MSYSSEELDEMLQNKAFMDWIASTDPGADNHWQTWMAERAGREEMVRFLREVHAGGQYPGSEAMAREIWETIQPSITTAAPVRRINWKRYAAAAAAVVLLGTGALLYRQWRQSAREVTVITAETAGRQDVAVAEGPRTLHLVDGSRVTLAAGSRLRYYRTLASGKRQVQLEGEAFFDVAHDAQRPFLVYSSGIVTKVLGTSFRVAGKEDITVAVRSGKVSVSRDGHESQEAYILLPNEQVVFNPRANTLNKSAVLEIALLDNPLPAPAVMRFDEAPATQVLDSLAALYDAPISFDRERLSRCNVTLSLEPESLYGKLDLICKVLGATWDLQNEVIIVQAPGCH
ncbi:FecR family protein [Chitinophaga lutea]